MSPNQKAPEGKLDPRVRRTRALILASFKSLLTEQGFESVTVQDVAARADINRATFYAHFPDKYALLDYAVQDAFATEIEQRKLDMGSYSPDNLRNLILIVCRFLVLLHGGCAGSLRQFESLVEGTARKEIFELLSRWFRKTKLPAEIPATVATWAIYGLASHYSHLKKRPALEKFVDEAFPLVAVNLEQFA